MRPRHSFSAIFFILILPLAATLYLGIPLSAAEAPDRELIAGVPSHEAFELGERMYREGILPSGEPMIAVVQGDIEIDGTMFTCQSCHLRSGMGSIEGTVITQPATGTWLYKPLVGAEMKPESQARVPERLDPPPFRPAYTDASLARAMWTGKDPNGRVFHPAMPRYKLSHDDMQIMVYYLKNLSVDWSPGVDDTTLRFATVVSSDVDPQQRQTMLDVLNAHVRDHNSQSRHDERRARGAPFYKEEKYVPYRRFSLAVWELEGERESWPKQLEAYYREAPVFALLGGMVSGDWAPIHEFSERTQVPCLFPVTDFPVVSESNWYTMYFSKGYYQEGETAARFLRRSDTFTRDQPVVQVHRNTPEGRDLARGFTATRVTMRQKAPTDIILRDDQVFGPGLLSRIVADHPKAVLVLWLEPEELASLGELAAAEKRPPGLVFSGSLLGDRLTAVPEPLRTISYLTHPYAFAEDEERSRLSVEQWLKAKKLPITDFDIQAKMYFVGWTLSGVVKKMRDEFYRDYFLDILGMMRDQYYSIAVYPRLSFGPGQRYASKGCYMAQITPGDEPRSERCSNWVIH